LWTVVCAAIADRNGTLNAFITVFEDTARAQARQADREIAAGRLPRAAARRADLAERSVRCARLGDHGASRVRQEHVAEADAPSVTALREAGAVIIGKNQPARVCFWHDQRGLGIRTARHRSMRIDRQADRQAAPPIRRRRNVLRLDGHRYRRIDPHSNRRSAALLD
jgi:Asp-tRNA(Asn)/Glu-tRNA(Gln) amidotransferase A subunit family amidase